MSEELNARLESAIEKTINELNENSIDGFHYIYKLDSIYRMVTNENGLNYIKKSIQTAYENTEYIDRLIDWDKIKNGFNIFDYPKLFSRLRYFLRIYNRIREYQKESSLDAEILPYFTSYLNAEIVVKKSEDIKSILIHTGLFHFQSFCIYYQYWLQFIDHISKIKFRTHEEKKSTAQHIISVKRLIRNTALRCLGRNDLIKDLQEVDFFEMTLWNGQERNFREISKLGRRMINWDFLEVFLLSHEIGHIELEHTEEIADMIKSTEYDKNFFYSRRVDMEFEADSYALSYAFSISSVANQEHNFKPNFEVDSQVRSNVIYPIFYFLVLTSFLEENDNSLDNFYPKSIDRFYRLFENIFDVDKLVIHGAHWTVSWEQFYNDIFIWQPSEEEEVIGYINKLNKR